MHTVVFDFLTILGSKQRYMVKINPRHVSVPTNNLSSTLPNSYHVPKIVKMLRTHVYFPRISDILVFQFITDVRKLVPLYLLSSCCSCFDVVFSPPCVEVWFVGPGSFPGRVVCSVLFVAYSKM